MPRKRLRTASFTVWRQLWARRKPDLRAFPSTSAQFDTIRKIAEEGSCVIVGRCADYVLRGMPEATNVFIYAEEEDKIKRAVEEYGVPADSVKKMMKDTDKGRANYYAYHTGQKWGEPVNYHLSLDSGYLEVEDIVDLIIRYTEVKLYK